MIEPDQLQKAIVAKLKANTDLVTAIGGVDRIKENYYQASKYVYPALRVDMGTQTPIGNGTDRLRLSQVNWMIRVFSEKDSSVEANNILGYAMKALFYTQIINATDKNDFPAFTFVRIDLTSTNSAERISERLWLAEAFFSSVVNTLNPLN